MSEPKVKLVRSYYQRAKKLVKKVKIVCLQLITASKMETMS